MDGLFTPTIVFILHLQHEKRNLRESHLKVEWAGLLWFSSHVPRFSSYYVGWLFGKHCSLKMSWSLVVYSVDLVAAYAGCTWKTMITYSFGVPTQRRCGDLSVGRCRYRRRGQFTWDDGDQVGPRHVGLLKSSLAEKSRFLFVQQCTAGERNSEIFQNQYDAMGRDSSYDH